MICAACSQPFTAQPRHPRQRFCSIPCYKRQWIREKRGYRPPTPRSCVVCKAAFVPSAFHPKTRTCSRRCSSRAEYEKHKKSYVDRATAWNGSHPEKRRAADHKCAQKRPELYRRIWRLKQQRRNATMRNVLGVGVTAQDWRRIIESQHGRCWWCGQESPLHMDHVIPVSKAGRHEPENIVGSCQPCNSRKRDRLWPRESGVLAA